MRDMQVLLSAYALGNKYIVCIGHLGNRYHLAELYKPPTGNFILLEVFPNERNASRAVNVVMPREEKNVFKLGRGHESDLRISDISVSRFHAILKYTKDGYYIEDNNSKFGTLAMATTLELTPSLMRAVQVGRTIVSASIRPVELLMYSSASSRDAAKFMLELEPDALQKVLEECMGGPGKADERSENKGADEKEEVEENLVALDMADNSEDECLLIKLTTE
eukprot:TRINITY_DN8406_c0_g2_i1.p1 TRINITY_DN8406_c0_g2~~TRINITY_DN8406_c0_g2_i1.p1  ORF type:complete len:222 (+),score=39.11 TRINITY_DN8406_c0_g2_i1:945-1610(+)